MEAGGGSDCFADHIDGKRSSSHGSWHTEAGKHHERETGAQVAVGEVRCNITGS